MTVKEITAKTVLHFHDKAFSSNWDVNTYRGCGHRCIYCFAQYSHKYINSEQFFDDIMVKTNVAEVLDSDFSKKNWQNCCVNLCGVTDAYQPIEKEYALMPKIIKTFIKHKNPLIITTKSSLILRDIDLLEELSKVAYVNVMISASCVEEAIREKIEPFAAPTIERFKVLAAFSEKGIDVGVLMMPIIPYLTDNIENLDEIFKLSKGKGAKSVIPQLLHLRGNTKKVFFNYMKELFPDLVQKIKSLYTGSYVDETFSEFFYQKINLLRKKYNFYNKPIGVSKCVSRTPQLQLF